MIATLAQIIFCGIGLIILALVGYMMVRMIRRKMLDDQDTSSSAGSFTLLDFKRMYENGELTQEEYMRIKAKAAARMKDRFLPADGVKPPHADGGQD